MSPEVSEEGPLRIVGVRLLQAECCSFNSTNSVKALKETEMLITVVGKDSELHRDLQLGAAHVRLG